MGLREICFVQSGAERLTVNPKADGERTSNLLASCVSPSASIQPPRKRLLTDRCLPYQFPIFVHAKMYQKANCTRKGKVSRRRRWSINFSISLSRVMLLTRAPIEWSDWRGKSTFRRRSNVNTFTTCYNTMMIQNIYVSIRVVDLPRASHTLYVCILPMHVKVAIFPPAFEEPSKAGWEGTTKCMRHKTPLTPSLWSSSPWIYMKQKGPSNIYLGFGAKGKGPLMGCLLVPLPTVYYWDTESRL